MTDPRGTTDDLLSAAARSFAAADNPEEGLRWMLRALCERLGASGAAVLRMGEGQLTPLAAVGMDAAALPADEAALGPGDGGYPLFLGGRLAGVILVRGARPGALADLEAALEPLLDLIAVALRGLPAPPRPKTSAPADERPAVLVVDDEPLIVRALERLFRREFEVVTATAPEDALELLAERSFALIVSDQRMPRISGVEFLARARQLRPEARRVLLVGAPDIYTTIGAINEARVTAYLEKPWDDETLLDVVRSAAARPA